jgi:protein-tyrosine phosphatase
MANLTDYHCHLLPGIDDGPSSLKESIVMARLLSQAGYHKVYCTPHLIKGRYEANNNTVRKEVNKLQDALNNEGIALQLLCGREYYIDNYFKEFINDLMPLEDTSFLLIEIPPHTYPGMVQDTISAILLKKLTPLLAHPERCRLLHDRQITEPSKSKSKLKNILHFTHPKEKSSYTDEYSDNTLLSWLIDKQCAFQENLPSIRGSYGNQIQKTAMKFKSFGIYTHSGTDAHSPECLEKLFGQNPL